MQDDIRDILESWPYDGGNPEKNYRRLSGDDGRVIIQVREPLGLQQMEYDGRPDGLRPQGKATWLDYFRDLSDSRPFFQLTEEDCQKLIQEGILFYQRYLILYQMSDWEGVVRDTSRNLEYFDFLKHHVRDPGQSLVVEQYRPYVMRMNSIARAWVIWSGGGHDEAISLLKRAIHDLERLEEIPTEVFKVERQRSIKHIGEVIGELEKSKPESQAELLRRELRQAILSEQFELAAQLRDRLRMLEGNYASRS